MHCGCYESTESIIKLNLDEENKRKLTPRDIRENEENMAVMCHEAVHALFRHDNIRKGVDYSTGILEVYGNNNELGRGLNEGLTNWVLQKIGFHPSADGRLTRIAKELELAIGPKRVMNLCKGDLRENVPKQLNMGRFECKKFLAIADEIYSLERHDEYQRYLDNVQDRKHIDNIDELIYNVTLRDFSEKKINSNVLRLENTIINKYCKVECQALLSSTRIDLEKANRFFKLSNLFLRQDNPNLKMFDELKDKYYRAIPDERIRTKIREGTLTSQDIMDYKRKTWIMDNRPRESELDKFKRELNRDRKDFDYKRSPIEKEFFNRLYGSNHSQRFSRSNPNTNSTKGMSKKKRTGREEEER